MHSDQPIMFQSTRLNEYSKATQLLLDKGLAFNCNCSRKDLPDSGIYPGTCRNKAGSPQSNTSVRLKTSEQDVSFTDGIQGDIVENTKKDRGDFVIWRADDLPAYQLAVVIDDAMQGITEIVRGADLIESTCRQIFLQRQLDLPTPAYIHLPVATMSGQKLSKRIQSDPVSSERPENLWQVHCRSWDIQRRKAIALNACGTGQSTTGTSSAFLIPWKFPQMKLAAFRPEPLYCDHLSKNQFNES